MTKEEIVLALERLRHFWETSQYIEVKSLALSLLEEKILYEDKVSLARVYNVLGNSNLEIRDLTNALDYSQKALQIYTENKDKAGSARVFGTLGLIYKNLSEFSKALEYYNKAIELFDEVGNYRGIADNLGNIGNVYNFISNYDKALEYFQKSLQINEEIGNTIGKANNFGNLGNVFLYLSDFSKALEYYFQALKINKEIDNKEGITNNFGNIGTAYNHLKEYDKAIEYLQKALLINTEMNRKTSISNNLGNLGTIYQRISNYSKAYECYKNALLIDEELVNKQGMAVSLVNLGVLHSLKESSFYDRNLSEQLILQSIHIAEEIGIKNVIIEAYQALHSLYLHEERYKEALEFQTKAITLKEEILSNDSKKQAERFDFERKNAEREKQIAIERTRFQEQEKILHNILPEKIADRILNQETFIADHFHSVSVLFMDIVGFTTLSTKVPPKQLVYLLDTIFTKADEIVESFGLEKIKTIGDGYLAVANVTTPLENHQQASALAALQLLESMQEFTVNIPSELGDTTWTKDMNDIQIRIGIHTGEVVAGIIGKNKFTYDLWGDAVNIASRMESHSEAGRIHVSEQFAKSIETNPEFTLLPRGEILVKGKGSMKTFWLEKAL